MQEKSQKLEIINVGETVKWRFHCFKPPPQAKETVARLFNFFFPQHPSSLSYVHTAPTLCLKQSNYYEQGVGCERVSPPDSQRVITKGRNTAEGETQPIPFTSFYSLPRNSRCPLRGPRCPQPTERYGRLSPPCSPD